MTTNVLLVGVGGQGTILASDILSEGLVQAGYDVKMSEIHGMAQRGGSVTTQIKFGRVVHSPVIGTGEADLLVAFEKLEAVRYLPWLKPGGMLIVNDYEIFPLTVLVGAERYPEDVGEKLAAAVKNIRIIEAFRIAADMGNPRAQNVVMLGAIIRSLAVRMSRDAFKRVDWEEIISRRVPSRMRKLNIDAFCAGMGPAQ
jgi:indolepyruvate ferredoxin oxidoreductase beta subunit